VPAAVTLLGVASLVVVLPVLEGGRTNMGRHDPRPLQEVDRLLELLLGVDQRPHTIGDQLKTAILRAMADAEERAIRRQGAVILSAICGDLTADAGCDLDWSHPRGSRTDDNFEDLETGYLSAIEYVG
jgi:hypothetical protein